MMVFERDFPEFVREYRDEGQCSHQDSWYDILKRKKTDELIPRYSQRGCRWNQYKLLGSEFGENNQGPSLIMITKRILTRF